MAFGELEVKEGRYLRRGLWVKCYREVKKDKDRDLIIGFGNMGLFMILVNIFSEVMGKVLF